MRLEQHVCQELLINGDITDRHIHAYIDISTNMFIDIYFYRSAEILLSAEI